MHKNLKIDNKTISYTSQGSGDVVLMLHGFMESKEIWTDFAKILSLDYRVICIDLPGFGGSSVFSDTHSMEFMADMVKKVLQYEDISNFYVVGHSMGGYVAMALSEKYGNNIRGMVMFHSQAAADTTDAKTNRNRAIEFIKENKSTYISSFVPLLFAEENVPLYKDEILELQKTCSLTSSEGIIAALAGMRDRKDYRMQLIENSFPVLFILGKQDSRILIDDILPQLILSANTEANILDKTGHMGFIEQKEKTMKTLLYFFKKHSN